MKKITLYITFIFFVLGLYAQTDTNGTITGYAPGFVGQYVQLYTYSDYITRNKVKLAETLVSPKDSLFKFENPAKGTIKAFIEIDKYESDLYLSKGNSYEIEFAKKRNAPVTFANQRADVLFYNLDSTDINYRILQYNQWLDTYIYYHQKDMMVHGYGPYIDTFKIYAYKAYENVEDPYFVNYVRYNIALLETTKESYKKDKLAPLRAYYDYINPLPVYVQNDQYMEYVMNLYPDDFESFIPDIKTGVIMAIENSSPTRLMKALHKDPMYEKDEVREMMMIRMLGKSYYYRGYDKKNIVTMLDSISRFAKFEFNAIMASNMMTYITKLDKGYPAPEVYFELENGDALTWSKYKGKFIYVNFFASWNESSVNEMKLIADLKQKYGNYVEFVSFSTDKTESDFKSYMKKHQDYQWNIIYLGENHELIKQFNVVAIPQYFLIDQDGFIAMAPAKSPSPNGVYDSIDRTFAYIKYVMEH